MIKDTLKPITGSFVLEQYDISGVLISKDEDHNMIMDTGRYSISSSMGGFTDVNIDKVVFGTLGYNGNINTPVLDGEYGFVPARVNLFSEESIGHYHYDISFTPTTNGASANIIEPNVGGGSTIQITSANNILTYDILLGLNAANNGSSVNYTEAALYCGSNIFAMKTFAAKLKDNSNTIRITWVFTF
jgi:hypothetical protein